MNGNENNLEKTGDIEGKFFAVVALVVFVFSSSCDLPNDYRYLLNQSCSQWSQ